MKTKYKLYWNDWFVNDPKTFTKSGNIAGPGYHLMTKWITNCWLDLSPEYIAQSFKYCGINNTNKLEFHVELQKIVNGIKPKNATIEERTEEDDFNYVFDAYNSECDSDYEPDEDEDFSSSSIDSEDDDESDKSTDVSDEKEKNNDGETMRKATNTSRTLSQAISKPYLLPRAKENEKKQIK
jgi:hypothetical protein